MERKEKNEGNGKEKPKNEGYRKKKSDNEDGGKEEALVMCWREQSATSIRTHTIDKIGPYFGSSV